MQSVGWVSVSKGLPHKFARCRPKLTCSSEAPAGIAPHLVDAGGPTRLHIVQLSPKPNSGQASLNVAPRKRSTPGQAPRFGQALLNATPSWSSREALTHVWPWVKVGATWAGVCLASASCAWRPLGALARASPTTWGWFRLGGFGAISFWSRFADFGRIWTELGQLPADVGLIWPMPA